MAPYRGSCFVQFRFVSESFLTCNVNIISTNLRCVCSQVANCLRQRLLDLSAAPVGIATLVCMQGSIVKYRQDLSTSL